LCKINSNNVLFLCGTSFIALKNQVVCATKVFFLTCKQADQKSFCHLDHVNLDVELSKVLEKMGDTEDDIGTTFLKFAVVTRELSNLMKNLVIITN
jgi:hypothetical protein